MEHISQGFYESQSTRVIRQLVSTLIVYLCRVADGVFIVHEQSPLRSTIDCLLFGTMLFVKTIENETSPLSFTDAFHLLGFQGAQYSLWRNEISTDEQGFLKMHLLSRIVIP